MSEQWISEASRNALWFSAKLRFELYRDGTVTPDCEDRIYLFQCPNPESGATKAAEVGRQQEHEFTTENGDRLSWKFVEVRNVMMTFLDTPLERGIEVYSERVSGTVLPARPAS